METEVLFERKLPDEELIERSAEILNAGGVIVIPTDTIPGIGCRVDIPAALDKVFELKSRPVDLPLPVMLSDGSDLKNYAADPSPVCEKLVSRYWPGPLTIVLKSNGVIDRKVGGGSDTIGFRVPAFSMVTGLVKKLGCPMALTSANPHNTKPTGLHSFLLGWWRHKVDLIILGQSTAPRPASAVVDIVSSPPKILRESYVDCEELAEILGINPC